MGATAVECICAAAGTAGLHAGASRGPVGAAPDEVLVVHIRRVLEASPFHGEGYRKVWAKLRVEGIRTSKERVRRLMREHHLQAPHRVGQAHGPKAHDGTITTETPDVMWATDMTTTVTGGEGTAGVFVAVDHCTTECIGLHAAKRGTRFEALEPIRQGVRERFGGIGDGAARGLRLRHDHGSNYLADDFQQEVAFFGIDSSPSFVREPEGNGVAERFIRTLPVERDGHADPEIAPQACAAADVDHRPGLDAIGAVEAGRVAGGRAGDHLGVDGAWPPEGGRVSELAGHDLQAAVHGDVPPMAIPLLRGCDRRQGEQEYGQGVPPPNGPCHAEFLSGVRKLPESRYCDPYRTVFVPPGLMREHDLQATHRVGRAHGPKAHDGTITTEVPDVMWGTDMTATMTVGEGAAFVFVAVDHCTTECIGLHAAARGNRFEALEPIRQGVREPRGVLRSGPSGRGQEIRV